ncbi:hypothetical protein [Sutterella sp.]|uniref:hypothetical protein n=1 Tax=Sutterella sp. TaxID=1981025 RepID=UPI0026DEA684|nr:hypothetical protein [Sutterella sp.]MDO5532584.1 hypothetical protein [Sutterella sp.]
MSLTDLDAWTARRALQAENDALAGNTWSDADKDALARAMKATENLNGSGAHRILRDMYFKHSRKTKVLVQCLEILEGKR